MDSTQISETRKWNELKKGKYANITPNPTMIEGTWTIVQSEELNPSTKKQSQTPYYRCYLDKTYLFHWIFTYAINPLKRYEFTNEQVINLLKEIIEQLEQLEE